MENTPVVDDKLLRFVSEDTDVIYSAIRGNNVYFQYKETSHYITQVWVITEGDVEDTLVFNHGTMDEERAEEIWDVVVEEVVGSMYPVMATVVRRMFGVL